MGTIADGRKLFRNLPLQRKLQPPVLYENAMLSYLFRFSNIFASGQDSCLTVLGLSENFPGLTLANHLPLLQHNHFLCKAVNLIPRMGNHDGLPRKLLQMQHQLFLHLIP